MNLEGILTEAISGGTMSQMSQVLGTDESTTSTAVQAALPMLLGVMTRNSSTPEGASSLLSALDTDHDGSILNNLGGLLGGSNVGLGAGILGHIFGDKLGAAQKGVSQASGLDLGRAGTLLLMLAPIVMGALGKFRRQGQVDESTLPDVLGNATRETASNSPISDMLTGMLDRNRDGSSLDDILKMAGSLFGRRGN